MQVVTVPKHEVLGDGKVVRIKRASEPRASWIKCKGRVNNMLVSQPQSHANQTCMHAAHIDEHFTFEKKRETEMHLRAPPDTM